MKKTKRPTEQELLHQWLEGDLDLTQQLYVEKDEPQPEAVEPYQPKRDRDTFLRSLRRSLRLYNVLAFLLCAVFAALMLMTVANLPRYGSAVHPPSMRCPALCGAGYGGDRGRQHRGGMFWTTVLSIQAGESFCAVHRRVRRDHPHESLPQKAPPPAQGGGELRRGPIVAGVCRG